MSSKKIHWILYNQLNQRYCYDDTELCVLIDNTNCPISTPLGKIELHPLSQMISYAAVRSFVDLLREEDYRVHFCPNVSWKQGLRSIVEREACTHIVVMDSSEQYIRRRLLQLKREFQEEGVTLEIRPNTQFIVSHEDFLEKYETPPVMETFYRWIRKRTGILMERGKPVGGKRNYDKENRKFDRDFDGVTQWEGIHDAHRTDAVEQYTDQLEQRGIDASELGKPFPTSRSEALDLLGFFIDTKLERFGALEDAMYEESDYVYHSLLSVPLNLGLLSPSEVVTAIVETDAPLNSKEGSIRQLIGWREYIYHWFHYYADEIYSQNHFDHQKTLPAWFWKPDDLPVEMNCLTTVLKRVNRTAYSHHIERLMVIGNFCLLVGYDPTSVTQWFWEQYADAYERVVVANVMGMSQFADGGRLATKPYVASANYINKMSNYCSSCRYDPQQKYGQDACPLNYLYRRFLDNYQDTFRKSRQPFLLSHLEKLDLARIHEQSEQFVEQLG